MYARHDRHHRSGTWAPAGLIALPLVLVLTACGGEPGGGSDVGSVVTYAAADAGAATAPAAAAPRPKEVEAATPPEPSASAPAPQPLLPGAYALMIMDEKVVHRDSDVLEPARGAGYRPLRAFVYQTGATRSRSPVAGVKPYCSSVRRCEYVPPRKSGIPETFTVELADDSAATLSANEDSITIRARHLALAKQTRVEIKLIMPGKPTITRQIIYAKARA